MVFSILKEVVRMVHDVYKSIYCMVFSILKEVVRMVHDVKG